MLALVRIASGPTMRRGGAKLKRHARNSTSAPELVLHAQHNVLCNATHLVKHRRYPRSSARAVVAGGADWCPPRVLSASDGPRTTQPQQGNRASEVVGPHWLPSAPLQQGFRMAPCLSSPSGRTRSCTPWRRPRSSLSRERGTGSGSASGITVPEDSALRHAPRPPAVPPPTVARLGGTAGRGPFADP